MWVVVRPARSEKKATCCSYGSVNMQQGGAWGRWRRRGGVIFIFGAEVLKVKVIPAICTYKFCGLCSYHQCLMRGRWTRKYSQCLFNKPNSEIQPLHCSPKRTIQIIYKQSMWIIGYGWWWLFGRQKQVHIVCSNCSEEPISPLHRGINISSTSIGSQEVSIAKLTIMRGWSITHQSTVPVSLYRRYFRRLPRVQLGGVGVQGG